MNQPCQTSRGKVVCISGMAGCGKSTAAKKIAEKYGLQYYSGGDALKVLAPKRGSTVRKNGWWESQKGMAFLKKRMEDPSFDKEVDGKLLERARQGNVVLDSWTMPWLLKEGFKIWLDASAEERARRIARRDSINVEQALQALKEKDAITKSIYKRLYGFKLGEDFSPFHVVLDVNHLGPEEVFQTIVLVIDNLCQN